MSDKAAFVSWALLCLQPLPGKPRALPLQQLPTPAGREWICMYAATNCDLATKKNNNVTTLICLAISVRAKVLRDSLVQYSRGLNPAQTDMAILTADGTCCFGKGRGSTETKSKQFANHNALGQLTNHNTFRFSEGRLSWNPELIEPFVSGWGERYCNNVNYVKNNAFFFSNHQAWEHVLVHPQNKIKTLWKSIIGPL